MIVCYRLCKTMLAEAVCEAHPPGSFGRVFWETQMQAASLDNARQMQRDPVMVQWCLYLHHLSSSAYEIIRETGTIKLPSQRTLRDCKKVISGNGSYARTLSVSNDNNHVRVNYTINSNTPPR